MKTSTKAILGVYGAVVGAWLAGSAYFLANGRDAELDDGIITVEEPLPREENAYYLFPKLHEYHQTNFNFQVANDFVKGWTNGSAVLVEVSELVAAHSNLFACARKILACRGYQIPDGENKMEAVGPLVSHPTARLYLMKAVCEAERGDREAAQATIDELIAFGRFVRRTGLVVGCLVGEGFVGMATVQGGRSPIAMPEDCAWRNHLAEVIRVEEKNAGELIRAAAGEFGPVRQHFDEIKTNTVMLADLLLRDGLEGFGWLARNNSHDGILSFGVDEHVRIDWERVDRSCVSAMLSCCLGYSRYSFKPNATLNQIAKHVRDFSGKLKNEGFDREFAKGAGAFDDGCVHPFNENWLGVRLSQSWTKRSVYNNHYRSLFCWRAGRLRLACENYRASHGRYPATLGELVPACIEAIPRDPYDGEPVRYNAEHGYFWTPGPDGDFDGKVDFAADGHPMWRNRNYHFVQLIDTTKSNRPPMKYRTEP